MGAISSAAPYDVTGRLEGGDAPRGSQPTRGKEVSSASQDSPSQAVAKRSAMTDERRIGNGGDGEVKALRVPTARRSGAGRLLGARRIVGGLGGEEGHTPSPVSLPTYGTGVPSPSRESPIFNGVSVQDYVAPPLHA